LVRGIVAPDPSERIVFADGWQMGLAFHPPGCACGLPAGVLRVLRHRGRQFVHALRPRHPSILVAAYERSKH
jgi:hypothetical protein